MTIEQGSSRGVENNVPRTTRRTLTTVVAVAVCSLSAPAAVVAAGTAGHGVEPTARSSSGPTTPADRSRPSGPTLRGLAHRVGLKVGTAVTTDALVDGPEYRAITASQFSSVTPENVMKWGLIEPTRGRYDWAEADRLVRFDRAHHQVVRGHTPVWHNQLPEWVTEGTWTTAQPRAILRRHVTDQVTHFKAEISAWDVVTEAFTEDGTLRDSPWLQRMGPGYNADAFRWAHQADPKAVPYYNDDNLEGIGPKSDAIYRLVSRDCVLVQGVGMQTHLDTLYDLPEKMQFTMKRFARLGVDVAITEAGVRIPLPVTPTEGLAQVADYSQTTQACWAVPRCVSHTVWGFGDAYSWVPAVFDGEGSADIFDENLAPKPAYHAWQQDLRLAAGAPPRP